MIEVSVSEGVAELVLASPPINAMSDRWIETFHAILDGLVEEDCSVIHIRSGLRHFSAGFDLKLAAERLNRSGGDREMDETTRALGKLFDRISALPQVTLAEISGVAVGGGLELALACDLRVAAHTAKLGLPELKLGLLPAAGGTQRLTALCGRATALRLILFSEQLSGVAAAAAGLVQWTVPDAEVGEFARRRAAELAAQPRAALELAKACIRTASDVSGAGLELEKAGAARLFAQEGTRVLVQRFLERAAR